MRSVFDVRCKPAQSGTIAAQRVRHDDPRLAPAGHHPGNEALCSPRMTTRLHRMPRLSPLQSTARHSRCFTPRIMITTSSKCHLFLGCERAALTCFATHHDASLGEQILNVAQTERKAMVSPNRAGNDGTREAVAFQARLGNPPDHSQAQLGMWSTT